MSHFTVLVIGANPEEQLAPFQENNCGDCPEEFMVFYDQEDEFTEEYNTGTREMIVTPGGFVSPYDDCWKVPGARHQYGRDEAPADLERREVPFKELYATLEEFAEEWHGAERDEERNRFGYMENPEAKWDWYQLGGRWTGAFKLKPGYDGETGKPGLMTESPAPGYVDAAIKGAVDFDGMRNEAGEEAGKRWDKINAIIAPHTTTFTSFEKFNEMYPDNRQVARDAYWGQPMMAALNEAGERLWDGPDAYLIPREDFVANARAGAGLTFAVIKDGKWYERGSMGWWGCVSDEKDQTEWQKQFGELLDSLPETTLLSVYDCHI